MNKRVFLVAAKESLLFAQGRARAFRISEAQIELWSLAARVACARSVA